MLKLLVRISFCCIRKPKLKYFNFFVFWLCHVWNFWKHFTLVWRTEILPSQSGLSLFLSFYFTSCILFNICFLLFVPHHWTLCPDLESSILCDLTNWELDTFEIIWMWFEMETVKTWNRCNIEATAVGGFGVIKGIN